MGQFDRFQNFPHLLFNYRARFASFIIQERQFNIFKDSCPRKKIEGLKHESDPPVAYERHFIIGKIFCVLSFEKIFTASRPVKKANNLHQG